MGARAFRPDELPALLSRMVRWRWPGERLLAAVPCEAEWELGRGSWQPPGERPLADEHQHEPGALGVTERRVVFRSLERSGSAFRIAAWTYAAVAAFGFLAGEPLIPPVAALMGALMWGAAHLIEVLGLGSGAVELGRIVEVDPVGRRIHGVDRWGVDYRLRLREREFALVAPLLER